MTLNKGTADEILWETSDYFMQTSPEHVSGYEVVNRNTGQVEMNVDTEPECVIGLLYLQDRYDEVMNDPMREFKLRKAQRESSTGGRLVS